ncbi:PIG-L family deacetylase [Planktomarina temperata]|nr:PIG-L family deacetylase [Planktomarina temperata]
MHTNKPQGVALFLFAHQDDEFGVFFQIEQELRAGRQVLCAFITDGGVTAVPERRNTESQRVLYKLGVLQENIIFLGPALKIMDGALHNNIKSLANWLISFFNRHSNIQSCFIPAWEGGHPDHDVLHAATSYFLASQNKLKILRQYSLYNSYRCPKPFFRVLSPLKENGPIEYQQVSIKDRLRYIRLCLGYPSQLKAWIGLFPFTLAHFVLDGAQALQPVDIKRLSFRPHSGCLYYEHRKTHDWEAMQRVISQLQKIFQFE